MDLSAVPAKSNKAVIWDMDGVIADTAPYHYKSWHEAFARRGIDLTEEMFRESFGQRNDTIIRKILGRDVVNRDIEAISTFKEESFRRMIREDLRALPGVVGLIGELRNRGFSQALASSAPLENITLLTKGLGIHHLFDAVVSDKDVTEGKPNPEVFLLAAVRLGVEPRYCIVIEDAVAGVVAAKRAGMRCIAVTNTHPKSKLGEADLVVESLESISVDDLERLLNSADGPEANPA